MDEAAHGINVDVTVGRIVLDMRRIGEQYQLHSHTPFGSSAGKLLHVLSEFERYIFYWIYRFITHLISNYKYYVNVLPMIIKHNSLN